MIHNLRKKLTFIYTVTIGLILTCVLIGILLIIEKSMIKSNVEDFEKDIMELSSTLMYNNSISHSWLMNKETEGQLVIHIEENAVPFLFSGYLYTKTSRDTLIEKAKELAWDEQVYTSVPPVSTSIQKTGIMNLTGSYGDSYLTYVMVIPTNNGGFKSLVLLHDNSLINVQILRQRIIFLITWLLAIAAVFLVSWFFVGSSLKPISINRKKQTEFIASASHELRSPLAVIRASASAISADVSRAGYFSGTIQDECARMGRLVDDMLVLASADTKGWELSRQHIDMDTLLLNIFEHYELLCMSRHIKLCLTLPDEPLPDILGDTQRLEQILSILIDNAMYYSSPEEYSNNMPVIELKAQAAKHHIAISVIDYGPGIPDEKKDMIFDRFFRGDLSRKDKSHFGLGLSVAKELACLHNGDLTLSDTPGGGCTFTLKLPCYI